MTDEPAAVGDVPVHVHSWTGGEFFLDGDEHPRFRMRCWCGRERVIRAWERFWDGSVSGTTTTMSGRSASSPEAGASERS